MFEHDQRVNPDVEGQRDASEKELIGAGQTVRVQRVKHVPRDEIALICLLPCLAPQAVFERRQGTDPAGELDQDAPDNRRNVYPRKSRPREDEQSTERDKQHEREVNEDDQIGDHDRSGASSAVQRTLGTVAAGPYEEEKR